MQWEAKIITHRSEKRIVVTFPKNKELTAHIKQLEGVRWSDTLGCWHLPDTDAYRERFRLAPQFVQNASIIVEFERWMRSKRLSESTINTYSNALKAFFDFYNHKATEVIDHQDMIQFNNDYILKKELSSSYQNKW